MDALGVLLEGTGYSVCSGNFLEYLVLAPLMQCVGLGGPQVCACMAVVPITLTCNV